MATRYTLEDIASHTGAKVELLRNFYQDLKLILEPLSSRGNKNRLYFDAGGFKVFEQAYQLKTQHGMTRPEIKRKMEEELLNSSKTEGETLPNSDKTEAIPLFILEKLEEVSNKAFEAERRSYLAQLEAKEHVINSLKGSLNALYHDIVHSFCKNKLTTFWRFLYLLRRFCLEFPMILSYP